MLILVCLAMALLAARVIERLDGTAWLDRDWRVESYRIGVAAWFYGVLYLVTWRPMLATALFVVAGIVVLISNRAKKAVVFEPIVFSDFGLLGQVIRYPKLYLLDQQLPLILTAAVTAIAGLVAAFWLEPAVIPMLLWPVWVVGFAGVCIGLARPIVAGMRAILLDPATGWGSQRLGLQAALLLQFLSWRATGGAIAAPSTTMPDPLPADCDVVVVQMESFLDLSGYAGLDHQTPEWDGLLQAAVMQGPLLVDARGANTMRTEHSVLTGIANGALGFDRFDPYLRARKEEGIAGQMAAAGWATVFIHPNDMEFFRRHRAIPALGFDEIIDQNAFVDAQRSGPYVGDAAVFEAVAARLEGAATPVFIFAVTMENHGPWRDNRLPGVAGGLPGYLAHQRRTDLALGALRRAIDGRNRRCLVVLYGDHGPALPDRPDIGADGQTNYLVYDSFSHKLVPKQGFALTPEQLLPTSIGLI